MRQNLSSYKVTMDYVCNMCGFEDHFSSSVTEFSDCLTCKAHTDSDYYTATVRLDDDTSFTIVQKKLPYWSVEYTTSLIKTRISDYKMLFKLEEELTELNRRIPQINADINKIFLTLDDDKFYQMKEQISKLDPIFKRLSQIKETVDKLHKYNVAERLQRSIRNNYVVANSSSSSLLSYVKTIVETD